MTLAEPRLPTLDSNEATQEKRTCRPIARWRLRTSRARERPVELRDIPGVA